MRVLLLHSATAGGRRLSKAQLVRAFARFGHIVRYGSIERPHWKRHLSDVDAVIAVGGDGTVAKVAIALAKRGHTSPALAVIPAGRANNIARALGATISPARLAAALEGAPSIQLAIGLIRSPWGETRFVESAGVGPLARLLPRDIPSLRSALATFRRTLRSAPARDVQIRADQRDLSGRYVMVQAMNIEAAGPRLAFAPRANPGDQHLDLVLLEERQRRAFARYIDRLAAGKRARCPVEPIRARRIEIAAWPAREAGHVDDKIWPDEQRPKRGRVRIEIETAIRVLVPRA